MDNPSAAEELYTKTIGPAPENFTVGQGITTRTDRRFAEDAVDAFVRNMIAPDFLQQVLVTGHVGAQREISCEHLY